MGNGKTFHAAAPKLLKIIEEPPAKTLFVGITDHLEQVLSTIRSRMQIIQIPTPTPEESLEILNDFLILKRMRLRDWFLPMVIIYLA